MGVEGWKLWQKEEQEQRKVPLLWVSTEALI